MTSRQFTDWLAYYSVDPFGDQRADLRAGIVSAVVANRWRGKNEQPLEPSDFMPFRVRKAQTPDEMRSVLASVLGKV